MPSSALLMAAQDPTTLQEIIDQAGPIAGLFVLLLGVALVLLFRSMNRQIKRIDPELPMGRREQERAEDAARTQQALQAGAGEQPRE